MAKTLDRSKPYCEIQGDSRASYYQAGKYFAPDGKLVKPKDAAKPAKSGGSYANQVEAGVAEELAKQNAEKPLTLVDKTNPSTNTADDIAAARQRAAGERVEQAPPKQTIVTAEEHVADDGQPTNSEPVSTPEPEGVPAEVPDAGPEVADPRRAELEGLHVTKLRQMVAELGIEPPSGRGSTEAAIRILLENTE